MSLVCQFLLWFFHCLCFWKRIIVRIQAKSRRQFALKWGRNDKRLTTAAKHNLHHSFKMCLCVCAWLVVRKVFHALHIVNTQTHTFTAEEEKNEGKNISHLSPFNDISNEIMRRLSTNESSPHINQCGSRMKVFFCSFFYWSEINTQLLEKRVHCMQKETNARDFILKLSETH